MRLASWRRFLPPAVLAATFATSAFATPTGGSSAVEVSAADAQAAQQHFQHAKDLYQGGSYREAIQELEAAHKLDPRARDLVYNLALVSEKLGRIDDALKYFHEFVEMDGVTAPERARAENSIRRLEGARHEVVVPPPPSASASASAAPSDEPPKPPPKGRIDALTIGAAGVGVAGVAVGTIFGIKALGDQPPSNAVTGPGQSYSDLASRKSSAHTEATVSDIGFAVGIVGVAAAAVLYFTRPKIMKTPAPTTGTEEPKAAVSLPTFVASPGGGTVVIGGTF